jgi:hypothetical protein
MKTLTILLLIQCLLSAVESRYYYIIADIANIRKQPTTDASVIARLHIGNSFSSSKSSGDWVFIDTAYRTQRSDRNHNPNHFQQFILNGWINSASCSETKVDTQFVDKQIMQATMLADSLKWLERRVGLTPQNRTYLIALQKAYATVGDTVKVAAIGMRLRGTDPTYLARKEEDCIYLLGVIDSAGNFRSLQWIEAPAEADADGFRADKNKKIKWQCRSSEYETIKKEALQVRAMIGGATWFRYTLTEAWERQLQLPAPAIEPSDSVKSSYYTQEGGRSLNNVDGTEIFRIMLGKSSIKESTYTSNIFATKRLYPVPIVGMTKKADYDSMDNYKNQLVGDAFDSTGVLSIYRGYLHEYHCSDVVVWGWTTDTYQTFYPLSQRGIFDQKGVCIWPPKISDNERESVDDGSMEDLRKAWFRFGPDAAFPSFAIIGFEKVARRCENCNGSSGLELVRVSETDIQCFTIISQYYGD